jgi:hypothetical protein
MSQLAPHRARPRSDDPFGILVVERASTRLFLCNRSRVREVVDDTFPVLPNDGERAHERHPRGSADRDTELLLYLWRIHAALLEACPPTMPIVLAGESGPSTAYRSLFGDPRQVVATLPAGQGGMSPRGLHHQALRVLGRSR